jgi:DNA-binding beta-propeller fold protein YncE
VWTASAADGGIRVLERGRARTVATLGHPVALASDGRSVVVAGADGAVVWIDGRTVATVRVGGMPIAAAFSSGAAWIADASSGTVRRVAPVASVIAGPPIDLGARPVAIAARGRDVYVACRGRLVRIDGRRGIVVARVPLPVDPSAIAVDDEYVWVAAAGRGVVARFDRRRLS